MTKLRTDGRFVPYSPIAVNRKLIVVLGMHRSGTSVITRGLEALGVNLGESLMPPAVGNNDKGFFEDKEIVALNDKVLQAAGRLWHSLEPVDPALLEGPAFFSLRAEAVSLLESKLRGSPVFGMKDPRLCVLMPFWMCVFEDLQISPGFVIALRNPLAAAQSLRARDELLLEHSIALWGLHMLHAVRATSRHQRVFVSFDAILKDPLVGLTRIAEAFDLPPPNPASPEFLDYAEDFLDTGMRRQLVGERELGRADLATSAVTDLYERLLQTALPQDPGLLSNADLDVEDILLRFADLKPLFRAIDKLQFGVSQAAVSDKALLRQVEEARRERQIVQEAHDDACRQRDNARAEAEHTNAQLAAHALALEQSRRHAAELQLAREIVQRAHDDACAQRDGARAELDHLRLQLGENQAALENANRLAADLEARRDFVQQAHNDACAQRDRAYAEIELLRLQVEERQSALDNMTSIARDLEARRDFIQQAHNDACGQRDAAQAEAYRLRVELEASSRELFEAQAERTRLEQESEMRAGEIGNLESELSAAHRDMQRFSRDAEAERARAETLQILAQHNTETVRHLQAALKRTQNEVLDYKTSTSWKLTSPIRGISRLIIGETSEQKAQRERSGPSFAKAIWKMTIGAGAPRAAIPPPAREALIRAQQGNIPDDGSNWLAVVVHAYYPEILNEILDRVARLPVFAKLYVTAPEGAISRVAESLHRQSLPFVLLQTENRGRDIAPFLSALALVREDRAQLLLKVHTKRSPHLENGDQWRVQLLERLLDPATVRRTLDAVVENPTLGILAPDGHILSVPAFLGENGQHVARLSETLGIQPDVVESSGFVAGSMFYARPQVFFPLMNAAICTSDFEVERGQLDGTLAHGIERLVGALARKQGMTLSALGDLEKQSTPLGPGAYRFV